MSWKNFLLFSSLLTLVACSAAPPDKLRNSPAGILMGDSIATWNNNTVTPNSFFDELTGEGKKWVKGERDGVWYIQEQRDGKVIKHYFVQNGSSTHMVYAKINVDGQDHKPFGD